MIAVAERFAATPLDVDDVLWRHRGELCTFDVMIEEFGLATSPLLRLATIDRGADTARPRFTHTNLHFDQKTNLPLLQGADHKNWNDKIGDEDLELSSALSAAVHAQRYP